MKKPLQSRTIQTGITLFAASITSIILHFVGVLVLAPAAIGAAISTAVSSALMIGLRLVTSEPVGTTEAQDSAEETQE